jgi:hypothetical protein
MEVLFEDVFSRSPPIAFLPPLAYVDPGPALTTVLGVLIVNAEATVRD